MECIICHKPAKRGRVCFRYSCGTTARARGWHNAAQVLKRQRDEAHKCCVELLSATSFYQINSTPRWQAAERQLAEAKLNANELLLSFITEEG